MSFDGSGGGLNQNGQQPDTADMTDERFIAALYDDDSGTWTVTTDDGVYTLNLDARVIATPQAESWDFQRLLVCELGSPLVVLSKGLKTDPDLLGPRSTGTVRRIAAAPSVGG